MASVVASPAGCCATPASTSSSHCHTKHGGMSYCHSTLKSQWFALGFASAFALGSLFCYYKKHHRGCGSSSSSCCSPSSSSPSCCGGGDADEKSTSVNAYPSFSVDNSTELDSTIQDMEAKRNPTTTVFVYVVATKDPATGVSWCGDCRNAEPIVSQVMSEHAASVIVIEAPVLKDGYKTHPYRAHPKLQLKAIPTLYKLKGGDIAGALVEGECADIAKVRKFVKGAIQDSGEHETKGNA